jgi:hypothetical protein
MIFLSVGLLTLVFFGTHLFLVIAFDGDKSDRVDNFLQGTSALYQLGFGAMVGLIGGKAV